MPLLISFSAVKLVTRRVDVYSLCPLQNNNNNNHHDDDDDDDDDDGGGGGSVDDISK